MALPVPIKPKRKAVTVKAPAYPPPVTILGVTYRAKPRPRAGVLPPHRLTRLN